MHVNKNLKELENEITELRLKLEEANDTIDAIRTGKVDALVVKEKNGHQLYTLKSADQTYRVFIEKMKEGAVTLNGDGFILYSNTRFAAMLGRSLSEVMGSLFSGFVAKEYKKRFAELTEKGWEKESKGEIILLAHNNEPLPILLSLTTLELDEGMALSIIITDLSLQKETEKELKLKNEQLLLAHSSLSQFNNELEDRVKERTRELSLSREYFKFLADNIPVIVWSSKPNGEIDYYNQKWYDYTGSTFEETKGWDWQKLIHCDDLAPTIKAWKHSLRTGKDYNAEYRFLRGSDETYRWHTANAVPFKNTNGEIITWFGICTDIEDQKLALTRKDEFISMASHELKTPVTILKAFNHVLLSNSKNENNPQAVDFLLRMNKQINKLMRLIADLLDATKMNAGEIRFEMEDFDFNDIVKEVVEQIQLTTESHKIKTELAKSHIIFGDKVRLGQVISNLLSNAIKYSPNADVVQVSSAIENNHLYFYVKDFGIGIPQEQQAKLFNRFFRASAVKTNTFPGLGLGLYISNEIIKRHSGSITFTSKEGVGSTFCFKLPL